jgi:hypothetical protein
VKRKNEAVLYYVALGIHFSMNKKILIDLKLLKLLSFV